MVDANMAMSPERAIRFSRAIAPLDVLWFEEPTTPGSYADFARVRAEGGIAVAQGENLHTLEEFRHALVAGAADFVQPDASNCGGITGFLKVSRPLARPLPCPLSRAQPQDGLARCITPYLRCSLCGAGCDSCRGV